MARTVPLVERTGENVSPFAQTHLKFQLGRQERQDWEDYHDLSRFREVRI